VNEFDAFIESAWETHAEQTREVAERLAASLHRVEQPAQLARYAALVGHVYGEHLGELDAGIALLQRLGATPVGHGHPEARQAVARHVAALRHVAGVPGALDGLGSAGRVGGRAAAAAIQAGRRSFDAALASYRQALDEAEAGLPADSPAVRALAVGGNNLAAALEEKTDRTPAQTAGMVDAARAALAHWKRAGGWLEEERAEYRLAHSLLQAGQATAAVESARRCVAVCTRHQAAPFEQVCAHAVLALALHAGGDAAGCAAAGAQARRWFEQVPNDERAGCEPELARLDPP
jgi:hypothetical protein